MRTNVRKWGNSAGAILPAPLLAKAGIRLGDVVNIEAKGNQIIIKQAEPSFTLSELLKATPAKSVRLDKDDKAWLHDVSVGEEIG